MDAVVARTVERFGRLDVMMCNAGFGIAGAIDDITPDQMQKLMDINYTGTYHATREELCKIDEGLAAARRGDIATGEEIESVFAKYRRG